MKATVCFVLVLCVPVWGLTAGNTSERTVRKEKQSYYIREPYNITETMERIFTGYEKNERPYHRVKPVNIRVSLGVTSICRISEENMDFQGDLYLRQFWRDPRLAYGHDNTSIIVRGEMLNKVWLPDTYIDNARKSIVDTDTRSAFISANGSVLYTYRSTHTISSNMNFLNYPMDEQLLKIQFYSYAYSSDKITLEWESGVLFHKTLAAYIIVDVTMLEEEHTYITGVFSSLTFQVKIHRRLGYFMLQLYFPCILSVLVSWLPFWMDRYEIGDRVSLGITTLLTEVFLSQYINSAMPQVSYIKAADKFLLASFIFILMALIESIVVYNVRTDVREKKMKEQKQPTQDKPQDNIGLNETLPLAIIDAFRTERQRSHLQPKKTRETAQRAYKSRDLGLCLDKLSRVSFPASYILFVAFYFGVYAIFDK